MYFHSPFSHLRDRELRKGGGKIEKSFTGERRSWNLHYISAISCHSSETKEKAKRKNFQVSAQNLKQGNQSEEISHGRRKNWKISEIKSIFCLLLLTPLHRNVLLIIFLIFLSEEGRKRKRDECERCLCRVNWTSNSSPHNTMSSAEKTQKR